MAPSLTATTFEPIVAPSASEQSQQPTTKVNDYGTPPSHSEATQSASQDTPTAAPKPEHKDFRDVLSYEDKWVGWDGPVWCKRYGRFENKDQAAEDDGYKTNSAVVRQGKNDLTLSKPITFFFAA